MSLHLQKEQDIKKYVNKIELSTDSDLVDHQSKYLDECCLNFKKILYILEI